MGRRKKRNKEPTYQRAFQTGDMVWLSNEYQRRSRSEPSLTLEDFAIQYGVSLDRLRSHIPELSIKEGLSIALWHGTTRARAESILEEGFKPKRAKKSRIFFTRSPALARSYANNRSKSERDYPAVIGCRIDLSRYNDYIQTELRGAVVFAFKCDCIASDTVNKVIGLSKHPKQRSKEPKKRENTSQEFTDVALTFSSGPAGVAYWINSCLELDGDGRVHEDHEAVGKIKQWLDLQVNAGRFGEVPSDEMLEQVRQYLQ